MQVEKELLLNLHTGRSLTDSNIPDADKIRPPDDDAQCCSKHVEDYNNKSAIQRN